MCLVASSVIAQEFSLTWYTIDGGVMRGTGGDFELSGTIGQPDAGETSGGDFELSGGFWFPVVAGDCNTDGGIDRFDFGVFAACAGGPSTGLARPECACLDFNADSAIDLRDFGQFQIAFRGP